MPAPSARLFAVSIGLFLLLTGCGPTRPGVTPSAAPRAGMLATRASVPGAIAGPVTACAVLATAHVLARRAEPHAAFTALVGTRIGVDGLPAAQGEWQVHYVGTEPAAQALGRKPGVPGLPTYRHVAVTATAGGDVRVEVTEQPGMPLGQAFFDAPMPRIDSQAAIAHARMMRPTQPAAGEFQLTLGGSMSPAHFQELVWKVQAPIQSGLARPVVFNATTGLPVDR